MKRPNKDLLKRFNVHNTHDNEFQANAKLLQCWWRIYSFLPKGKYGYMLPLEEAKKKGYNFLTDNIRKHVKEEIENKEVSNKLIDGNRLYSHMLSSQAMTFNLFGELKSKLELATNVFNKLFNNKIKKVDNIEFEYSPGRRNIKYTGDRTAFDVFIEYTTLDDSKGFFGIEVKYSEDLKPFNNDALIKSIESYNKNKTRYHEITNESKIFKEEKFQQLTEFKIFQIWIKHLLALSLMQDYAEGFFIYLYPRNNEAYQNGLNDYQNLLISSDYDKNHLHPMHLETFVEALKSIDKSDWIKEFEFRYFRFHQLKFIKARQDVRYYKLAYELNNKFQKLLEKNEVFFNADKDHLYLISLKDTNLFREIECIDKVFEVPYDTFFSRLTNIKNLEIINEDNIKELVNILKVHEVESVTNDFLMKTELLRLKAWVIKNALINNNYLMFDKNIKYITTNLMYSDSKSLNKSINVDIIGYDDKNYELVFVFLLNRDNFDQFNMAIRNLDPYDNFLSSYKYQFFANFGSLINESKRNHCRTRIITLISFYELYYEIEPIENFIDEVYTYEYLGIGSGFKINI